MHAYWTWWIVAAVLVGIELVVGTFYVLAIGIAVALGGVAAWLGASEPIQFTVAGVLGVVLTVIAHRLRVGRAQPPLPPPLDVGQSVQVRSWNPDGTARVAYRGTEWDAELAAAGTPRAETMYIVATRANTLLLSDRKPAA
jgi:membrane protein implicated in regulation of membrane protease activity